LRALMAERQPLPGETRPSLRVIAGANHFFLDGEVELFQVLRDFPW
jgi:hypothetical protein